MDFCFFVFVFYWLGGSPRPVAQTPKIFFYFSILISSFRRMSFPGWIFVFVSFLFFIGLGAPLGLFLKPTKKPCFLLFNFNFLFWWDVFLRIDFYFFLFFFSIGLGASLGLFLKPPKIFFYFSILISSFRRMSFLGWIFVFV